MPLEIFNLQIPECLSTRKAAAETFDGVYSGNFHVSLEDRSRLAKITQTLEHPLIFHLIDSNQLTLGLIKPHAHFPDGKDLPLDDEEGEKVILSYIDPERIIFKMPFKFTKEQSTEFYGLLKEKYSKRFNDHPNKYDQWGKLSVFEAITHFTSSGPLTIMLLSGENAVEYWRGKMGATNPEEADPNSIRGRHGLKENMPNTLVHGSGSAEEARREIGLVAGFLKEFYKAIATK